MEALAEFDFTATEPEELSFRRFDILKILDMKSDAYWFKAELEGREGFVPFNYIRLRVHSWFHTNLSRQDAESVLRARDPEYGTNFLVRTSESRPEDFSISLIYDKDTVRHLRVMRDAQFGMYYIWTKRFSSLNQMVEYYKTTEPILAGENVFLKEANLQITHCVARFDFIARQEDELTFLRGQIITVTDNSDGQWWEGALDGRTGNFPASYVVPCAPPRQRVEKIEVEPTEPEEDEEDDDDEDEEEDEEEEES